MNLDEISPKRPGNTDRRIAEAIIQNPRGSLSAIAAVAQVPIGTLNKHLMALRRANAVDKVFQILDWRAIGYSRRYRIDVLIDQRALSRGEGGLSIPESSAAKAKATRVAEPEQRGEKIDSQEKLATYIKYTLSRDYAGRIVVLDVNILLGHAADLSVTLCARGKDAIRDFVTNGLRKLGGVYSTSTAEEIWTCPPLFELSSAADEEFESE